MSWNSTCFGQFVCPSSGVYSLYTQQWYMSYRFVESFWAGPSWNSCRVSCQNKFVKLLQLVGFITKKGRFLVRSIVPTFAWRDLGKWCNTLQDSPCRCWVSNRAPFQSNLSFERAFSIFVFMTWRRLLQILLILTNSEFGWEIQRSVTIQVREVPSSDAFSQQLSNTAKN